MLPKNLKPTNKNLIESLKKDYVGRNSSLYSFIYLLNSIDQSYSISLDGNWGTGKTFFVKQAKLIIDAFNDFTNMESTERTSIKNVYNALSSQLFENEPLFPNQVTVYFDAWENDNYDNPLLSLVYAIINEFDTSFDFIEYSTNDASFVDIVNRILSFTPIKGQLPKILNKEDLLKNTRQQNNLSDLIEKLLDSLMEERGDRLVVFIDELDRCNPIFAVKLLEQIKHYFDNERITFVFSINKEQLQYTIKKHYGNDFNASKYLDRFFDLCYDIPAADMQKYYQCIKYHKDDSFYCEINTAVFKTFGIELRELGKYLYQTEKTVQNSWNKIYQGAIFEKALHYSIAFLMPIVNGLRITDNKLYHEFISGKNSKPLFDVYKNCNDTEVVFHILLNKDEVFEGTMENPDGKKEVSLNTKLDQLYNLVFGNSLQANNGSFQMGSLFFHNNEKTKFAQIIKSIPVVEN